MDYIFEFHKLLCTLVNTIGRNYVSNQEIYRHALSITILNQGMFNFQSSFC